MRQQERVAIAADVLYEYGHGVLAMAVRQELADSEGKEAEIARQKVRAERAEALAAQHWTDLREQAERAERAEAALARVWELHDRWADQDPWAPCFRLWHELGDAPTAKGEGNND